MNLKLSKDIGERKALVRKCSAKKCIVCTRVALSEADDAKKTKKNYDDLRKSWTVPKSKRESDADRCGRTKQLEQTIFTTTVYLQCGV